MNAALKIESEVYFEFFEKIAKPNRLPDLAGIGNCGRDQKKKRD
jgi:hypothetical protein